MKIVNSLDWDVDRSVGTKVGRDNNGEEYSDVCDKYLSGDVELFR